MALTITRNVRNLQRTLMAFLSRGGKIDFGTIAFDSEYATGGESLTFPAFKETSFVSIPNKAGYGFEYDYTNKKVKVYYVSGATSDVMVQVASSSDLSALTSVPYFAIGY